MALRTLLTRGKKAALLVSAVAAASAVSADPQLMFDAPTAASSGGTDLTTLAGPDQSTGQSLVSAALDAAPSASPAAASASTPALPSGNAATSPGNSADGLLAPEPTPLSLVGLGATAMLLRRRKQQQK